MIVVEVPVRRVTDVIEIDDSMIEASRSWRQAMIQMLSAIRPSRRGKQRVMHDRDAATFGAVHVALVAIALTACSSLVDDPCADGYMLQGGNCVERVSIDTDAGTLPPDGTLLPDGTTPDGSVPDGTTPDGSVPDSTTPDGSVPDGSVPDGTTPDGTPPDAGVDAPTTDAPPPDAGVDAPVPPDGPACAAPSKVCDGTCTDVMTSPTDCGSCGHVCASGICTAGVCAGELAGHIVAIGHDYQERNAAMARVIGNAAALASSSDLGIAHVTGTATVASRNGTTAALATSLASMGRTNHQVALPTAGAPLTGIDVLVIDAQTGDAPGAEALGAAWKPSIDALLARHGVVIVVEGVGGVSHRFAAGAGLFNVGTPVDTTGSPAFVTSAGDAVTQQVVSPYLADTTSVVFPAVVGAIATPSGTVVMHLTR